MNRSEWISGECSHSHCQMTLVRYVGGGQWVCWLHALMLRII